MPDYRNSKGWDIEHSLIHQIVGLLSRTERSGTHSSIRKAAGFQLLTDLTDDIHDGQAEIFRTSYRIFSDIITKKGKNALRSRAKDACEWLGLHVAGLTIGPPTIPLIR